MARNNRSSSVGMTQAEALLPVIVIFGSPAAFAGSSKFTPNHAAFSHAAPNFRGVLADAGGEDQRVQPTESGGERSQLPADTVDKQGNGIGRVRVLARQQSPHVIADTGDTEKPGLSL